MLRLFRMPGLTRRLSFTIMSAVALVLTVTPPSLLTFCSNASRGDSKKIFLPLRLKGVGPRTWSLEMKGIEKLHHWTSKPCSQSTQSHTATLDVSWWISWWLIRLSQMTMTPIRNDWENDSFHDRPNTSLSSLICSHHVPSSPASFSYHWPEECPVWQLKSWNRSQEVADGFIFLILVIWNWGQHYSRDLFAVGPRGSASASQLIWRKW